MDKDEPQLPPIQPVSDPAVAQMGREMLRRVESGDQEGVLRIARQFFPEAPEQPKLRPIQAEVRVPIEAIDGTPSVGTTLALSNEAGDFVVLEVDGKKLSVRIDQLMQALSSLRLLKPHPMHGPLLAPHGCFSG